MDVKEAICAFEKKLEEGFKPGRGVYFNVAWREMDGMVHYTDRPPTKEPPTDAWQYNDDGNWEMPCCTIGHLIFMVSDGNKWKRQEAERALGNVLGHRLSQIITANDGGRFEEVKSILKEHC